jgi:hypothetical protein
MKHLRWGFSPPTCIKKMHGWQLSALSVIIYSIQICNECLLIRWPGQFSPHWNCDVGADWRKPSLSPVMVVD